MFTLLQPSMGSTLQSCAGPVQGQNKVFPVYSFSQGKTCFHYRETLFSLQGPCFHYRDFPVRKRTQGKPCFHYRERVCSALKLLPTMKNEAAIFYHFVCHVCIWKHFFYWFIWFHKWKRRKHISFHFLRRTQIDHTVDKFSSTLIMFHWYHDFNPSSQINVSFV